MIRNGFLLVGSGRHFFSRDFCGTTPSASQQREQTELLARLGTDKTAAASMLFGVFFFPGGVEGLPPVAALSAWRFGELNHSPTKPPDPEPIERS